MSTSRKYKKNIESAFKNLGYEETQSVQQTQIKKAMDNIAACAGFQAFFNPNLADLLWVNTRKQKDKTTVLLKNYILTITDAMAMLQQKLTFLIKQQNSPNQTLFQSDDFRDYKTLFLLFNSPNIGNNNSGNNPLSNSKAERLSFRQQNSNMQIINRIKGVSEDPAMKLVEMGVNCAGEKKFQQAMNYWKQALQLEPKNYLHHSNICRILNVLSRHEQAITYGETAVKLNQRQAYAHMNLALAYAGRKRFQQAQKHSKIGFDMNPNNPLCCIDRAHILDQAGKTQEADELYDLADKLNNSQSRIKFNQDHINETLERKFKRLVQYIDNMVGKQNEKKQLKEDVNGLKKDMIESQYIIQACENMIKKQEKKQEKGAQIQDQPDIKLFNEMKQKFNKAQQQLAVITNRCDQLGQKQGSMVQIVQGHDVQIEKLDKQVKRLRDEMKTCLNDMKGMKSMMERIQLLEKKMSESPSLGSKQSSRPESERISAKDLQSINDQLMDIIEEYPEGLLMITVKIENSSEMNQPSISSFCKLLKKLKKIETFHLVLKHAQESLLSRLKDQLVQLECLVNVKITSESGQEILNGFRQEISKKKSSIICETVIKK